MLVKYSFTFQCTCPVDNLADLYDVEITSDKTIPVEKILDALEDFFSNYEPKFGEKIKVRRMLKGLKELKLDIKDTLIKNRLRKLKDANLKNKDIEFLKSLDQETLDQHLKNLKKSSRLPLLVHLMEQEIHDSLNG